MLNLSMQMPRFPKNNLSSLFSLSHRPKHSSKHVVAMKIYSRFVIFGPGKLRKRSWKVLEKSWIFFWALGVRTLNRIFSTVSKYCSIFMCCFKLLWLSVLILFSAICTIVKLYLIFGKLHRILQSWSKFYYRIEKVPLH